MSKRTPEEILDELLDGFCDKSGQSEDIYVSEILKDAKFNARYEGGVTEEQLDILDSSLEETARIIDMVRDDLKRLRRE